MCARVWPVIRMCSRVLAAQGSLTDTGLVYSGPARCFWDSIEEIETNKSFIPGCLFSWAVSLGGVLLESQC